MRHFTGFKVIVSLLSTLLMIVPAHLSLAKADPVLAESSPHTPVANDGSQIEPTSNRSGDIVQTSQGAYSKGHEGNKLKQSEKSPPKSQKENNASQESVIGPDNRTRVKDPSKYPYSAIVHIESDIGSCTGWMISPDTVATAGHCIFDPDQKKWASWAKVYPGRDGDRLPYGYAEAKRLYSVAGWTRQGNSNYDYGAIKLDKDVGKNTGWFGYRWQTGSFDGTQVNISGYPGDKDHDTQWEHRDQIRETTTYKLLYNNDTYSGQSGSPVYQDQYQECGVCSIAIHTNGVYGNKENNRGTRITKDVFDNLNTWKNQ